MASTRASKRRSRTGPAHVLLLNNDATVEPGFLEPLVEAASAGGIGAACAQILDAATGRIWYAGASYDPRRGHQGRHTGYGDPPLPPEAPPYETERACGGAMLIPRAALESVGLLDESLFAYAEDVDWSVRARAAGLRILVVPASIVHHRVSASTGGAASPDSLYYALRNGLVVAERSARLGRVDTFRRRAEATGGIHRAGPTLAAPHRRAPRRRRRPSRRPPRQARAEDALMAGLREDPGLWLLLHLRPPGDRRHDVSGRCAVCGAEGRLVRNGWMLSRDLRRRYGSALADRESLFCGRCGCSLRVRRIAEVLIGLYGTAAATLAELVREDAFRALRIAEINSIGRMHPILAEAPGLVHVEYPEEDIQALSWADGAFDLVLTSETLEHVPDPRRALRETFRVLRPGGRHIFTVPVDASLALTRSRDGLPPEHHGRGGGPFALVTRKADMLVHTDFGGDLPDVVRAEGFDVATDGEGIELVVVATRPEA